MFEHKAGNPLTRREALCRVGNGFGMMAFASAVSQSLVKAGVSTPDGSVMVGKLDYPQRVKRVIFLFMNGGCSTIDSFLDPKSPPPRKVRWAADAWRRDQGPNGGQASYCGK